MMHAVGLCSSPALSVHVDAVLAGCDGPCIHTFQMSQALRGVVVGCRGDCVGGRGGGGQCVCGAVRAWLRDCASVRARWAQHLLWRGHRCYTACLLLCSVNEMASPLAM